MSSPTKKSLIAMPKNVQEVDHFGLKHPFLAHSDFKKFSPQNLFHKLVSMSTRKSKEAMPKETQ